MVGQFVYSTYEVDADALAMPTTPLDEVLRLRGQCESQAKQQQLDSYAREDSIPGCTACTGRPLFASRVAQTPRRQLD
jgi:hypothetical protein